MAYLIIKKANITKLPITRAGMCNILVCAEQVYERDGGRPGHLPVRVADAY
jgi:hypothetical protein